jgi:hypothetical protein
MPAARVVGRQGVLAQRVAERGVGELDVRRQLRRRRALELCLGIGEQLLGAHEVLQRHHGAALEDAAARHQGGVVDRGRIGAGVGPGAALADPVGHDATGVGLGQVQQRALACIACRRQQLARKRLQHLLGGDQRAQFERVPRHVLGACAFHRHRLVVGAQRRGQRERDQHERQHPPCHATRLQPVRGG